MKLSIRNLSKSFGPLSVLNHVSMDLESGNIYCLMGASGSGKTTFLRILMGLEMADSGSFEFFSPATNTVDSHITSASPAAVDADTEGHIWVPMDKKNTRISAVFQEDRLCEQFTPIENIMMVTGKSMTKGQVREEVSRLLPEESLSRPVTTLSGGMKRRTAICRAILADYDLLLMDEPFTGLDDDTRQKVIQYILEKTRGKLVILSTHQEQDIGALGARLINLPE